MKLYLQAGKTSGLKVITEITLITLLNTNLLLIKSNNKKNNNNGMPAFHECRVIN